MAEHRMRVSDAIEADLQQIRERQIEEIRRAWLEDRREEERRERLSIADRRAWLEDRREEERRERLSTAEIRARREAAKDTARKLLMENLSFVEKLRLIFRNCFRVTGQSGRKYMITYDWSSNVKGIDDLGRTRVTLCVVTRKDFPVYDQMLAQKLWLEHNEYEFWRMAGKHYEDFDDRYTGEWAWDDEVSRTLQDIRFGYRRIQ